MQNTSHYLCEAISEKWQNNYISNLKQDALMKYSIYNDLWNEHYFLKPLKPYQKKVTVRTFRRKSTLIMRPCEGSAWPLLDCHGLRERPWWQPFHALSPWPESWGRRNSALGRRKASPLSSAWLKTSTNLDPLIFSILSHSLRSRLKPQSINQRGTNKNRYYLIVVSIKNTLGQSSHVHLFNLQPTWMWHPSFSDLKSQPAPWVSDVHRWKGRLLPTASTPIDLITSGWLDGNLMLKVPCNL